ncbi:prolactin receptor, partial [Nibea albiflora]
EEVASTARPHIYYCRSPNMEDFTCWWHPLDNLTEGEQVTYVFSYTKDKGPKHECPDYVSAGPNSCHFDSKHTTIWKIYCMNVTAVTAQRNYTSQEHCLDVGEIVQTEAPVNLTYELKDAGGDEMGHNCAAVLDVPGALRPAVRVDHAGARAAVKHPLREPHVELLGLPVGDYVVRVRCRSQNYGLWSKWSSTLLMSIPARPLAGKLLLRILMAGVGVVALVVIIFGIIPQSKREKDTLVVPCDVTPVAAQQFTLQNPKAHTRGLPPYCSLPAEAFTPTLDVASPWPRPEIMTLPGSEYSVMGHPKLPNAVPAPDPTTVATSRSPQDFYTCVQLMNETGEVHLVQCLPPAYCREFPSLQKVDLDEEEKKKKASYQVRVNDCGDVERSEAADPLLPVAVNTLG